MHKISQNAQKVDFDTLYMFGVRRGHLNFGTYMEISRFQQ